MAEESIVYVVEDDPRVSESLVYLLESAELQSETFGSAEAFLEAFDPRSHGCLLLDVRLPGMDGLELQRQMVERKWRIPVIIISAHGDISMAVTAMRAGAFDFVEKPYDDRELLERIQKAIEHDSKQWDRFRQRDELQARLRTLTNRETEVLDLVVEGEPTKGIAKRLGTSFNTVQNQRASILKKMQARSVADLVRMVMIARSADI